VTRCTRRALLGLGLASAWAAGGALPESPGSGSEPTAWEAWLGDGFSYRLQGLGYGFLRDPVVDSALNPGNALDISRYQATSELRLDMRVVAERLTLGIKPRFELIWQEWDAGPRDGASQTDDELFVNEWLVRYRFGDRLFASYVRENLQWGPSFLLSPSNPFIEVNGKNNPWLEMPGLDYAKLSWLASPTWSTQFIANTGEGRWEPLEPFRKVYAGKLDYVDFGRYGSVILSRREGGPSRLGAYAGVTISDAALAHLEGNVDDAGNAQVLVGGSYTFADGSTAAVEYYHNGAGCRRSALRACFPPYGDASPGQNLYRRNYAFLQYFNNEFLTRSLELVLRGTFGLDDSSGLLSAILNYELGDHAELFTVAEWYAGSSDDEFGSILKYSIMGGVSLVY